MLPAWTEVISKKETEGKSETNVKYKHEIYDKSSPTFKKDFLHQQSLITDGEKILTSLHKRA